MIGHLLELQSLNKTPITEMEREDAERWLIRQFMDDTTPPPIYHTLVAKHGKLDKLVELDMKPDVTTVSVEISFQDKREQHSINTHHTLKKFKKWLSKKIVGLPASEIRVFYLGVGYEYEMVNEQWELYRYELKDGDLLHIELKTSQGQ